MEVINDVVQEFINQIVFLRICEDKNLPLYHKLKDTIEDVWGEDTDIVIMGMWFCNECGNVLGRKMSQYENEIDPKSV